MTRANAAAVLVIDDDPDIREIVSLVLESVGYLALAAKDGEDALRILRAGVPVKLILLDMMMPGMDGWRFRECQRRDPQLEAIPLIVLTGDGRAADKAEQIDAVGFLRKPVDLPELLEVVSKQVSDG
jgi:two-component system, chemotaxis family, chemotaxis protein CheY